jgi:hypothetical protein
MGPDRNRAALASMIAGVCGFLVITIPVSIVLGVVGLVSARRTGRGAVLALVGIVLAVLWAGVGFAVVGS